MKKVIFIALLAAVTIMPLSAQQFQKDMGAVNLGIGIGTVLGGLGTGRPAVTLAYDHGMWDIEDAGVISIGGYFGNAGYSYKDAGYSQKWNYWLVGARGAYHHHGFKSVPQLDPYVGLMLGYNIVTYSSSGDYTGPNSYGSGIGYSIFLGSRWFFNDNFAAFAELGYGITVLNAGVSFKF